MILEMLSVIRLKDSLVTSTNESHSLACQSVIRFFLMSHWRAPPSPPSVASALQPGDDDLQPKVISVIPAGYMLMHLSHEYPLQNNDTVSEHGNATLKECLFWREAEKFDTSLCFHRYWVSMLISLFFLGPMYWIKLLLGGSSFFLYPFNNRIISTADCSVQTKGVFTKAEEMSEVA